MKILANAVVAGGMIAAAVMLKKLVRSRRGAHATPTDEAGFSRFAGHDEPGFHALAELDEDLRAIDRDEVAHQGIH
jgi:hypothetical protein